MANNRVVFNIGGIKYRLIVKVEYHFKTIYIRPPRSARSARCARKPIKNRL